MGIGPAGGDEALAKDDQRGKYADEGKEYRKMHREYQNGAEEVVRADQKRVFQHGPAGIGDAGDRRKHKKATSEIISTYVYKQGLIIPLEEYIAKYMPNLSKVFEQAPEYKAMCCDTEGHIWGLPWIEQLGYHNTAVQLLGNMPFINTAWPDLLNLEMPTTIDEFEQVLIAFRDNAAALKAEFRIDGDIIPMSCIVNGGGQDPYILINGFGEGCGDSDAWKHLAVTDEGKVVSVATSEGFKKGSAWLHSLYGQGLIDAEAFTQDWSTYVAKGKSGRCVVPSVTEDPALVCSWLEQTRAATMYTEQAADGFQFLADGKVSMDVEKYDLDRRQKQEDGE